MPRYSVLCAIPLAFAFTACSDEGLTTAGGKPRRVDWSGGRPHLTTMSETDAVEISDPYAERDLFSGLNVGYEEFFEDPEAVSDAQFEAQGPASLYEWESDKFEADAAEVYDYCTSSSAGGGGGPDNYIYSTDGETLTSSWLTCEQKLERCWSRCRRIAFWDRRARALCWGGCMAAYALCVRRRNGE